MIQLFAGGIANLANPECILLILLGVTVGIVFGSLPGLSTTTAFVLFLPLTYTMGLFPSFAILMAIYVGGVSGGLISAILINAPGTVASVSTAFDGYPMTQRGEGPKALGVALFFSFLGTLLGIAVLVCAAPSIAKVALIFTNYEYFALTLFSLTLIAGLAGKSLLKGISSGCIGITLSMVGLAPIDSFKRFTFGYNLMMNGFEITALVIAFYAYGEILKNAEFVQSRLAAPKQNVKIKGFGFSITEFKSQIVNLFRSSAIGIAIGVLPGIGGGTSNLISYSVAKNSSKYPEQFGTGVIDGIVASESCNNASLGGALVPLLTLGIPGDGPSALLLGAFTVHGLAAGPLLFTTNGDLVYYIFACMLVSTFAMLIVEYFGMRIFVRMLSFPLSVVMSVVFLLCIVGTYAINSSLFDVASIFGFAILGLYMKKFGFPVAPAMLGFILGPMVETYLRRGLQMSQGSIMPFFTRPISLTFILLAVIFMLFTIWKAWRLRTFC